MADADLTRFAYPVGFLSSVRHVRQALKAGRRPAARGFVRKEVRSLRRLIGKRDWHNLRQHFNGFLYEPEPWPEGARKCGSGWTRAAARRSFYRRLSRSVNDV